MSTTVAIDLGAANTRIAGFNKDGPELFSLREGKKLSSIVAIKKDTIVVGSFALKSSAPSSIVTGATLSSSNLNELHWSNESNNGKYNFPGHDQPWTRQQIIAELLKEVYKSSKPTSKKIVLTIPDFADQHYRQVVLQSAEVAGLHVVQLINQTTAAAMAYSYAAKNRDDDNVLLINFGAGSFSASVFQKDKREMHLISTSGSNSIGGHALTIKLMKHFLNLIPNLANDKKFLKTLRNDMEKAIEELAFSMDARIELEHDGEVVYSAKTLTRQDFVSMCQEEIGLIKNHIIHALNVAKKNGIQTQRVFLCGGSSKNHFIKEFLDHLFSSSQISIEKSIIAEEAVAIGAAINAAILNGYYKDTRVSGVANYSMNSVYIDINGILVKIVHENQALPIKTLGNPSIVVDPSKGQTQFGINNEPNQNVARLNVNGQKSGGLFFDINKNGLWEICIKEGKLVGIEYLLKDGEISHLLTEQELENLRSISGAEVSDKKEALKLLASIARYLMDEDITTFDVSPQASNEMYQKLYDYLNKKLQELIKHNNSLEFKKLRDTKESLLTETKKLSNLELVDKAHVNQIASDLKNQLSDLSRKPCPEAILNIPSQHSPMPPNRDMTTIDSQAQSNVVHIPNAPIHGNNASNERCVEVQQSGITHQQSTDQPGNPGYGPNNIATRQTFVQHQPSNLEDLKVATRNKIKALREKYRNSQDINRESIKKKMDDFNSKIKGAKTIDEYHFYNQDFLNYCFINKIIAP
uniref:Heat shock protein 70 n=1 Tax=Acrobeloides nanus TaxID=290746 RepID=A0A914CE96_9BILA